jgi:protein Tex
MLDDGEVPFIARYRKDVTRAIDDAQLRALDEHRRAMILNSIREQGKRRRASSTAKAGRRCGR